MDKVIKFPSEEIRSLAKWEKDIRSIISKAGFSKDTEDIITPEILDLIKKYNSMAGAQYQLALPETLNEDEIKACEEVMRKALQESFGNCQKVVREALSDLMVLRMQLYTEKGE